MIEYYYYIATDNDGSDDWIEYAHMNKGKIPFKNEKEMSEGFPLHYPGCIIWSWADGEYI
jgi:hypothetical protein